VRFISEHDAESVFISVKTGCELKTEEEYIDEILKKEGESKPKSYWGEFS
jgi:hypothetical protein